MEQVVRDAAEAFEPSDLAASLPSLERIAGASKSMLFTFRSSGQLTAVDGSIGPILRDTYAPYYIATDPLQHALSTIDACRFLAVHQRGAFEVMDGDEYLSSVAYHEVHSPNELEHQLLIFPSSIRYGEPGMLGLLFTRGRREEPFEPDVVQRFVALESALRAATRRIRRFRALQRERDAVAAILALDVDEPRALVSAESGMRWANEAAGRAFARSPDLKRRLEEQVRAFECALARPLDVDVPAAFELPVSSRESATGDLHVVRDEWERPLVLCRFALRPVTKVGAVKLTPSEKLVLGGIMRGQANKEIAKELAVSPETVRSHVKNIFRKLKVDTRVKAAMWGREHSRTLAREDVAGET